MEIKFNGTITKTIKIKEYIKKGLGTNPSLKLVNKFVYRYLR